MDKNLDKVVGKSFEEMSVQEMTNIQGAGTMSPQSTPMTPATPSISWGFAAVSAAGTSWTAGRALAASIKRKHC